MTTTLTLFFIVLTLLYTVSTLRITRFTIAPGTSSLWHKLMDYRALLGATISFFPTNSGLTVKLNLPGLHWDFALTLRSDSLTILMRCHGYVYGTPINIVMKWVPFFPLYMSFYCLLMMVVVVMHVLRPFLVLRCVLFVTITCSKIFTALMGGNFYRECVCSAWAWLLQWKLRVDVYCRNMCWHYLSALVTWVKTFFQLSLFEPELGYDDNNNKIIYRSLDNVIDKAPFNGYWYTLLLQVLNLPNFIYSEIKFHLVWVWNSLNVNWVGYITISVFLLDMTWSDVDSPYTPFVTILLSSVGVGKILMAKDDGDQAKPIQGEKEYWKLIDEEDKGQVTDNPHILARRHMDSGLPTTAAVLNTVLRRLNLPTVTDKDVQELLIAIKNRQVVGLLSDCLYLKVTAEGTVVPDTGRGLNTSPFASVYHIEQLSTGHTYVGQTTHTSRRMRHHLKYDHTSLSKLINNSNLHDFRVTIMLMPKSVNPDALPVFEQLAMFELRPTINRLISTGAPSAPLTPEQLLAFQKEQGKKAYCYKGNKLIYVFDSMTQVGPLFGRRRSWLKQLGKTHIGVPYGGSSITFSFTPLPNTVTDILELETVTAILQKELTDIIAPYQPKSSMPSQAMNVATGKILTATSVAKLAKLVAFELGYGVYGKTIIKYSKARKAYNGWLFSVNNDVKTSTLNR